MNDLLDNETMISKFSKRFDHTVLHPTATNEDFLAGCDAAIAHDVAALCAPSSAAALIARRLSGSSVKACATIGFPHGNPHLAVKIHEAVRAVEDGAEEIDMVVHIGKVKMGAWAEVEEEIAAINDAVTSRRAIVKVIFETCYLNDDAVVQLSQIASTVGTAFIKTSTGFGSEGATVHHVSLMRKSVPDTMGIKASGGIRTLGDVERFIAAGATRIGTSSTAVILAEAASQSVPVTL